VVNYLTLVICCVSCLILGGLGSVTWAIFREKDLVEQLKDRIKSGAQHNVVGGQYVMPEDLKPKRPSSNKMTGDCPVSVCNIKGPHSHAEALIRRVKEK
jgi:hypothetical protein